MDGGRWPSAPTCPRSPPRPCSPPSSAPPSPTISRVTERAPRRCPWARGDLDVRYHDEEWGVPLHDDRKLFELLILEGAQAGLSWDTVLQKRARYREVFDGFDAGKIARYDKRKVRTLLKDPGIIRNRMKIDAAIGNARAFLLLGQEFG